MNRNPAPAVANVTATAMAGVPVDIVLPGSASGITLRIISQPQNGSVGIADGVATYFPFAGFTGTDTFTFSAYDGSKNSALATATVVAMANNPTLKAPSITTNPASMKLARGAAGTMNFWATGTPFLSYQWYKNGWPIAGATTGTLVFKSAASTDAATYVGVAKNSAGAKASKPATLTVGP